MPTHRMEVRVSLGEDSELDVMEPLWSEKTEDEGKFDCPLCCLG